MMLHGWWQGCKEMQLPDTPVPPCVDTCPTGALVLERLTPDEKRAREQTLLHWLRRV